ncbi:hypothetical protein PFISCL1PPCAC_18362, partial [Pristionchus fissidentatus]
LGGSGQGGSGIALNFGTLVRPHPFQFRLHNPDLPIQISCAVPQLFQFRLQGCQERLILFLFLCHLFQL